MSIAEKLATIAENEQKVYDAGKSTVLKAISNNYTRKDYAYAFYYTDFSGLSFEETIKPTNINAMFRWYAGEYIPSGFDSSEVPVTVASGQWLCREATKLKCFPDINYPAQSRYGGTWEACYALETIEVVRSNEDTIYDYTFAKCWALKNIAFEGVIGQNISFDASSQLTKETLLNNGGDGVFGKLKDYSGTGETRTITLHADTKAMLTDAEKALATEKGWTIA